MTDGWSFAVRSFCPLNQSTQRIARIRDSLVVADWLHQAGANFKHTNTICVSHRFQRAKRDAHGTNYVETMGGSVPEKIEDRVERSTQ